MTATRMFGRHVPEIALPSVALRAGRCSPQQSFVSVRGLMPQASRMDSALKPVLRALSGAGSEGHSSGCLLQGPPIIRADQFKASLFLGPSWPRRNSRGKVRCAAIATQPELGDVTLAQMVRAGLFYLTTSVLVIVAFFVSLLLQPFVLFCDKKRRRAQHFVNEVWATLTTCMFYRTEVEGWENLPAADEGAVYVANHQSLLDIYALFELRRPFKFISKTSNFLIPFIGWCMYLAGHIPLQRMDKRSQVECLKRSISLVQGGVPVLFFPEGTRTTDGAMAAFKKGAFVVAVKGGVPVVPITLIGSGKLMPNGLEYSLRSGIIKVIVHPPIYSRSVDELCNQSKKIIAETLMKHGLCVHN